MPRKTKLQVMEELAEENGKRIKDLEQRLDKVTTAFDNLLAEGQHVRERYNNDRTVMNAKFDALELAATKMKTKLISSSKSLLAVLEDNDRIIQSMDSEGKKLRQLLLGFVFTHMDDDTEDGRSHFEFCDGSNFSGSIPLTDVYRFFRYISNVCFVINKTMNYTIEERAQIKEWTR